MQARSQPTRVGFGEHWLRNAVLELLQNQLTRFRPIMISLPEQNSLEILDRGEVPALSALFMNNGTVWPWNRACYGVSNSVAHLRIENRALPAGPTVVDEVANTAFFIGLMLALPQEYGDIAQRLNFDDAKANFFAAARRSACAVNLADNKTLSAARLIEENCCHWPAALKDAGVDARGRRQYLDNQRTLAPDKILKSLASMEDLEPKDLRYRERLPACSSSQKENARAPGNHGSRRRHRLEPELSNSGTVYVHRSFTVRPDDLPTSRPASWIGNTCGMYVEDEQVAGRLITHRALLHLLVKDRRRRLKRPAGSGPDRSVVFLFHPDARGARDRK